MNRTGAQKPPIIFVVMMCLTLSVIPLNENTSSAKTIREIKKHEPALKTAEAYGNFPISFEPNHGQTDKRVKFLSRGAGHSLYLTSNEAWISLRKSERESQLLRMTVVNGNKTAKLSGEDQLPGRTNYLIGNRTNWKTDLPTYGKVRAHDIFKGIDLDYYGSDQRHFEYDFVVAPGADPKQIKLSFAGAKSIHLDEAGALRFDTEAGELVQKAPYIYQEVDGKRLQIKGSFVLGSASDVTFDIGEYDPSRTLVIDPELVYTSYFGGSGDDRGTSVSVDSDGNAYVTGSTLSSNLILNPSLQSNQAGMDAFVIKVNPAGTQLIYQTYLGSGGTDFGNGIAVTADGQACITGGADSEALPHNFPLRHEYQDFSWLDRGLDVFVTLLNAAGNDVTYSTFIGGEDNDAGNAIALDASGNIYVTGFTLSRNFPTKNAFENRNEYFSAFVAKFNPRERGRDSLVYSTFLAGNEADEGLGIAVTSVGVAFVTGYTESLDFPIRSSSSLPPFQSNYGGGRQDGFVAKLSPAGELIYSTYYGGDALDEPAAIAVDENERAYITGQTTSSAGSLPFRNAFDTTKDGSSEAFVVKFNADGTTVFYSSLITGTDGNNQGTGIAIDPAGSAHITGSVVPRSVPFPEINGFPVSVPNGSTFFVKVGPSDATGSIVPQVQVSDTINSGRPAGLALDPRGNVYIAGGTSLSNIATQNAFQPAFAGGTNDAYVLKFSNPRSDTIGVFRASSSLFLLRNSNTSGAPDLTVEFGEKGDLPVAGDWDGNGVTDVGVFRPSRGEFLLRVSQDSEISIFFGAPGDLPVAGDWDGDGIDTPGVFRPGPVGTFLLTNSISNGATPSPDIVFTFGVAGDRPVAGDWNGDSIDTIGIYRINGVGEFHLSNDFENSTDIFFNFGVKGDLPIAGDWTRRGFDTPGVFRPSKSTMFLANNFANVADIFFVFGQSDDLPIAGDWDGN